MSLRLFLIFAVAVCASSVANAQTITTEFSSGPSAFGPDEFVTGPVNGAAPAVGAFAPVTLTNGAFDVTFSGGQQQAGFDGPSYSGGNAAYLFVNTGPGAATFEGTTGNTITGGANNGDAVGLIQFGGLGASDVSFFAADRANGANTTASVFGVSGTLLDTLTIPSGSVSDNQFTLSETVLGEAIESISFNLPGPASPGNPPYVAAIDSFSATASATVPEPSGLVVMLGALAFASSRRRR